MACQECEDFDCGVIAKCECECHNVERLDITPKERELIADLVLEGLRFGKMIEMDEETTAVARNLLRKLAYR
jgi:hypothetical protein